MPVVETQEPLFSQRGGRRYGPVVASVVVAVIVCLLVTAFVVFQLASGAHADHAEHPGPGANDYVEISDVPVGAPPPAVTPDGSTGSFAEHCGSDADGLHRNADNVIASPGVSGGAHHVHDYVGNLSTNAFSTDASLAAAGTTCASGDKSTFYWPVLRILGEQGSDANAVGGGVDGNVGRIITASSVNIQYVGSPVSKVVAAPEFLRETIGDPKALTDGGQFAAVHWTCTGHTNQITEQYPICPTGSQVERIFDFPSCWDGRSLDSTNHHTHLMSPAANGECPHATFPVPELRIVLTYAVPTGSDYAIDSFPEQLRSPISDHGDYIDVMSDQEQAQVVSCINSGRAC
ncbi:MAG TPA: DUF1996 domain-containing protein [Pseudonocardiaceae bacterium]|nr:DUF1996 domain-containing protein [Pseudonocardiaceae bacterium]